jgi:hypothetical protein
LILILKPIKFLDYILTSTPDINFGIGVEYNIKKVKPGPLPAWTGPEGSRKLRFPDFMTTAQNGGKVVSPYAPAAFTPRKHSWYSFLLEAESTPGS